MPTRLLLVDNHRLVLESLRTLLDQKNDLEVVGMAEDGRTALSMIEELSPDVVVMDIGMPRMNGMEATSQIADQFPRVKIVALSMHTDGKHVRSMLEAGAHGYVSKETASVELIRAIRKVRRGMKYLSSDVTAPVVEGMVSREIEDRSAMTRLGSREREVLQLIAEGETSGEIAAGLHISINTVDTHRRNIMKKLDLHSIADLTRYAIREGLAEVGG